MQRYTVEERTFALEYGRRKLEELRAEGVERVQVMSSGDGNVCSACRKLDGKVFLINDAPDLPVHEESPATWYICRCIYLVAAEGARLSPRKLPRISVTGLESLGLSELAIGKARRRIIERLRDVKCDEHGSVPTSVHIQLVDATSAKVTVASCCVTLHQSASVAVALSLRPR